MARPVLYMAHPVSGDVKANIHRALNWLSWLRRSFPETTFIAPWIVGIMSGEDDADPAQREAGLVDCCAVVERCDGIVLVGGRVSTGMARERDHGVEQSRELCELLSTGHGPVAARFAVHDLTGMGATPPGNPPAPKSRCLSDGFEIERVPFAFVEWFELTAWSRP